MNFAQSYATQARETIFLTRKEALRAIQIDFQQYAPQMKIWREISPMVLGEETRLIEESHARQLWLVSGRNRRLRPIEKHNLGTLLVRELEHSAISLGRLAVICGKIFQTKVRSGPSEDGRELGLHLETGMEAFNCKKCGKCCRNLDYSDQFTRQDYQNLKRLGREDLLEWVRPIRKNNGPTAYRIWVPPGSLAVAAACPWLHSIDSQGRQWQCAIHDAKPEVCRQYPGTRKHAIMTGCPGFND